jgi:hypothetical protein
VQQVARRSVNERIDSIGCSIGGVEYVEIAMWHDAIVTIAERLVAIHMLRASRFSCASLMSRRSGFRALWVGAVWELVPFGSQRSWEVGAFRQLVPFSVPFSPLALQTS